MAFILSLIAGFGVFFLGQKIFRWLPPYPLIDSLRIGRAHYLLLGVLVGTFFSETDEVFRLFEVVRYNCIGAILLWIGLQAGPVNRPPKSARPRHLSDLLTNNCCTRHGADSLSLRPLPAV